MTVSSGGALALGLEPPDLRVKQVAQAVAEQVEGEDGQHDRRPGVQDEPRGLLDVEAPLRQGVPPRRHVGGTPTPRNESAASVRTAAAKTKLPCTITGDRQFGRMCRPISVRSEAPSARPAST